jgi:16S rRNA processing protein RimM
LTPDPGGRPGGDGPGQAASDLPVGRVGRAHGLDGSFYVTRADARMLGLGAEVLIAGRRAKIVRRAGTDKRPIVRLEGLSSRTDAEALRGEDMRADITSAPALADGEFYAHELEGCAVMDGERLLGTVKRLLVLPSCEALEVTLSDGGGEVVVPMVKDAIRDVDARARRIDVDGVFLNLAVENPAPGPSPAAP